MIDRNSSILLSAVVSNLNEVVEDGQWKENDEKLRQAIARQNERSNECEDIRQEDIHHEGQGIVDAVRVAGETIQNATTGCRVEERDGTLQEALQQQSMESSRRFDATVGECEGSNECKQRIRNGQTDVNREELLEIFIVRLCGETEYRSSIEDGDTETNRSRLFR